MKLRKTATSFVIIGKLIIRFGAKQWDVLVQRTNTFVNFYFVRERSEFFKIFKLGPTVWRQIVFCRYFI